VNDGIGCGTYTVAEGDYPTRVASQLGTTVDELAAANEDTDGYGAFYVGLVINVPC
jgi:LysM repeat protein